MARTNFKVKTVSGKTHEGALAKNITKEQELRRSVLACMLWENSFYEDGEKIATRIQELVPKVDASKVANLAVEARENFKLRHAPLLLVREMAKHISHKYLVAPTLARVIQRADELAEFLSLYWKDGKTPISAQVKKGLAWAFVKFNEYELAKYNRDNAIKLRDVMFLTHPKPLNDQQEDLWKRLANNNLKIPDTWEVNLSIPGIDKKFVWERLLKENKLGALALLRNLRNMSLVGVDRNLILNALNSMKVERVLPYRFIAASKYATAFESALEKAMLKCLKNHEKLNGSTILLVDVSGSMGWKLSDKSDLNRIDAANGLAMLLREICDDVRVFTFSNDVVEVPARRGFALSDAIWNSQSNSSTFLGKAVNFVNKLDYDRLIVLTDEQSYDVVPAPTNTGYMINVASYQRGVGYGQWNHIDGFSESVIDYIIEYEK